MTNVIVTNYDPLYQPGIDLMMQDIQQEFKEVITGPQSVHIKEVYQQRDQRYWVALCNGGVVGTIGIVLRPNFAEVKRMMVHREFRGSQYATAKNLLDTALDWVRLQGIQRVYLGTMDQFKAAQRFYEKSGFSPISKNQLPGDYKINPIDTLFYTCVLG